MVAWYSVRVGVPFFSADGPLGPTKQSLYPRRQDTVPLFNTGPTPSLARTSCQRVEQIAFLGPFNPVDQEQVPFLVYVP